MTEAARSALDLAAELGHERILIVQEPAVGLRAVIAMHDTTLGPATGGTRMRLYPSFDDAVADALHLARAMTAKAAFAGLACGGGKAVIFGDPARDKTPELLEAYARRVDELGGSFFTGGDMGIDGADLEFLGRFTRHVGQPPSSSPIDASELTAIGVHAAMRVVADRLGKPLPACRVAIQGVGEVGGRLARRLSADGVETIVTDAIEERAATVARATGATRIAAGEIQSVPCDLFSPNAGGEGITEAVAAALPCRAVVGAANHPLASERAGEILHERGVLYAPDFVVNAGGILSVLFERGELDEVEIVRRVERLGADLAALLDEAERDGLAPLRVADRIVAERLAAARAAKRRP